MVLSRSLRRMLQGMIAPAVFLLFTSYFCWQASTGDRGLQTFAQRREQLQWAQKERDATFTERDALERRVANLKQQHMDTDELDERVRLMLGYGDSADVSVQYGRDRKLF